MITPLCLIMLTAAFLSNDPVPVTVETPAAAESALVPETAALPSEPVAPVAEPVATPALKRDTWRLRYQFHKGESLRYETEQNMTLNATVVDARRIDRSALRQRRLFTVQSVNEDGSANITMQFEHVWMQKKVDDLEPLEFDSTMKSSEVPAMFQQVAHQLKGSAPKYWLSTAGLSKVDLNKAKPMVQTAIQETTGDKGNDPVPLVEAGPLEQKVQQVSATPDPMPEKRNTSDPGSFVATLPEHEVGIGDTWKETITVTVRLKEDINIQIPILRTFRLESVENDVANISFHCSVQSLAKNPVVMTQLIQATPHGTISFDIARGQMLRREMLYDETVFGAMGQNSLLTSVGRSTEVLLTKDVATK